MQGAVPGDAGVVDQNIHRAQVGDNFLHRFGALPIIRDVEFVGRNTGLVGEAPGRFVVSGVGRSDLISGILQSRRDGFADSAGAAGHNCDA